jgi:hypothetical protein
VAGAVTADECPYPLGDSAYPTPEARRDAILALVRRARELRDPNYVKSGYAPRKAELAEQVVVLGEALLEAVEPRFMGIPERWLDDPTWLCENGHVSKWYVKSEERGDLCPACRRPVRLCDPDTREAA